jgi:hypothetical protein
MPRMADRRLAFGVAILLLTRTTELLSNPFGDGQEALFRWNDEALDGQIVHEHFCKAM